MTINFVTKTSLASAGSRRAFTLVETLVALSILLIAVVGPISLIGDSLHKMYYARDEAIGVNLAQEGIEMVRQIRDTNMLNGAAWLTNLGGGAASSYVIDSYNYINGGAPASYVIPCAGCNQAIYYDANRGLYRQGTVFSPTQFTRLVTVSSAGLPANEAKVTSVVTWNTGGTSGSATLSEHIFSWAI